MPCNPGERLCFDNDNALTIQQNPGSARYIHEVTDLGPLLDEMKAIIPKTWTKKRTLIYRNRGIGDQLICSAASKYLTEMHGVECHQLSDRVHEAIWQFNPYIQGNPLSLPMHLDTVWRSQRDIKQGGMPFFHEAFFFESVSEWDSDSEQPNVYDRLFGMLGFDPARVQSKYKRPVLSLQRGDIDNRVRWTVQVAQTMNMNAENGYIVFQPRATNVPRSLPHHVVERVLQAANEYAAKLQMPIFILDDKPLNGEILEMVKRTPQAINTATAINNPRLLIALIAGAHTVIGPDSVAIHIAAAQETATVGIWGPFSPDSRCKYYARQIHIHHRQNCMNSPCFNYLPELPYAKCPRGTQQPHCECFDDVSTEEIFEAIKSVSS